MALTRAQIERQTPPPSGRLVLWDGALPGFGVRVFASGQRSFILRYRMKGSRKLHTETIGTYGKITLDEARSRAKDILADVRRDVDPTATRKARALADARAAQALTVARLVADYTAALRAGTARTKRTGGRPPVPAYVADTVLHLGRFASAYGKREAATLARADIVTALSAYADQPSAQRRLHGAIHRMYVWARRLGLVESNPATDIETVTSPARERVLSLAELAQVWHAAEDLDPLYRDIVHLLITTGQRRAEVGGMRWGEIDLARAVWTLPGGRTKARRQHSVPLSSLAIACLQARRAAFGHQPAPDTLVLPTTSRDGKRTAAVSGWRWLKGELDARAQIPTWRLHDFRRSLVTHCAELDADVAVLDTLLNHAASATRGGIIGVYQRATLLGPMRQVIALWDGLLRDALGLTEAREKVVALRRSAADRGR
jgi:integrase